jgi:Flp pilus assembly secretin CpaC
MIQIKPLIFPTVGTASAVIVQTQSFELLAETDISFNIRFFEENKTEIFNSPINLTRPEIKNKSEEEIISIIFEKTNIERK